MAIDVPRPTIAAERLVAQLARDPAWLCVDCRFDLADKSAGRRGFETATIPGSVYADLEADLSGPVVAGRTGRHPLPEVAHFEAVLRGWGVEESTKVCVFDEQGGSYAARLWWMLHFVGHTRVRLLVGGTKAFVAAGGVLEPGGPGKRPPSRFVARPRPDLLATAADVEAIVQSGKGRLVDARAGERFRGEVEPIDREPGHIPGALNLPWAGNIEDGALRSTEALRERFAEVAGEEVVLYCGSGVTACHDAVAMVAAGFAMPKLYVGSWSEWITDPSRPRAIGP